MLQLKVFYNISFPEGDRCEIITTKENEVVSFKELSMSSIMLARSLSPIFFSLNKRSSLAIH